MGSMFTNWLWAVDKRQFTETDLDYHQWGEFSMAALISDGRAQSSIQLESGEMGLHSSSPYGTFVGIYDGHGGYRAYEFAKQHLFEIVKKSMSDTPNMSANVLDKAFSEFDNRYLQLVREWEQPEELSCLVGVIIKGKIYIANAGDCKAVVGRLLSPKLQIPLLPGRWAGQQQAIQLPTEVPILQFKTQELEPLKLRLRSAFHYKDYSNSSKSLIPTSRPIDDVLKKSDILYASTLVQDELKSTDQFIIFGSPGLWKFISNEEAVDMVMKSSRKGIAMRLLKHAMKSKGLKELDDTERTTTHNDISVVVLFLDYKLITGGRCNARSTMSS